MVREWFETGMFHAEIDKAAKASAIVSALTDTEENKSHSRHIGVERAERVGLKVRRLEDDQELQDAVLGVHHSCIITLNSTPAFKIIENHFGITHIQQAQMAIQVPQGLPIST